jgi:carboxymethylenebutenolidase
MPDFAIRGPHGDLPIYCAAPTGTGRFPGVVVIHDAGGMSAKPYHRGKLLTCIRQIMCEMRARRGRSFDEIDTVRTWFLSALTTLSCRRS